MVATLLPPRWRRSLADRLVPASYRTRVVVTTSVILVGLCLSTGVGLGANGAGVTQRTLELKRMSIEELLQQPVVSVSRRPEQWGNTASGVLVLSNQASRLSGATTLPQLLRLAPTLFVSQSSSSHWAVNARGFVRTNGYSNKLLVLIDGRTVYSPFFSNVFWDSQDIFLPDLQQIEVLTGPSGAAWGSNAVNGIVNIVSRSAHDTLGGKLIAGLGTNLDHLLGVRYGVPLGDRGALRVYAKRSQFEATLDANGQEDEADGWDLTQGGFRADWHLDAHAEFTLQGDIYEGRYDHLTLPEGRTFGGNVLARWERPLGDGANLWLRTYYDYYERDTYGQLTQSTHTWDLEFQHRFLLGDRQELLWGANYRVMEDRLTDSVGFAIVPERLNFDLFSLFAQHEIANSDRSLWLTSGLRFEENHFSGWELLPSVRAGWRPASGHTLWAAVSRATRIPDRLDRGFVVPATEPYVIGPSPAFGPETVDAYELGWRTQPSRHFSVTATAFFHDYDDLRSVELTTPITVGNGVRGESYGLELLVDYELQPWWRIRTGGFIARQHTSLKPGSTDVERGLGESSFPEHQVHLRSVFDLNEDTTLWLGLRRVAAVPGFENNTLARVPAYTELDATLTWAMNDRVSFSLVGRNLLHRSHPEIGPDATRREIERSVQVISRWNF